MQKHIVCLNLTSDVKRFVTATQACTGDVKVCSKDDKYCVDGKSILGLFSLDLSRPVKVYFEKEEEAEEVINLFEKYTVL